MFSLVAGVSIEVAMVVSAFVELFSIVFMSETERLHFSWFRFFLIFIGNMAIMQCALVPALRSYRDNTSGTIHLAL